MTKSRGIGRGGKRPGAGKKPKAEAARLDALLVDVRDRAALILHHIDEATAETELTGEEREWKKLLQSKDETIALRARVELSYLAYPIPKPVDAKVAGTVEIHFHAIDPGWRKGRKSAPSA
jgi:hypothetical protein